ncbi:hypothetical protein TanjilG_14770 [Lupinus angustifolius]|uniref:endo-polygalacturonase n=1 Tax=Lupinus angustifolius TaxID=3871 RepID=A0A1J7HS40_LUPAN|nr:PREDICTED: polygalacturonase-like [Lupinus angustifolius]OIW05217.1 hypothetical protein TanjilG_14770 [Lupinus angustifolius]
MSLQRHLLLSFIIIIVSCGSCYCSKVQEGPLSSIYVHDSPSIDDDYGWIFKNFIKRTIDFFSSNEVVKVGYTKPSLRTINVNDFGAKGNGIDDNSVAYMEAWQAACSSGDVVLVVPEGNYLLKPIRFSGPCKSNITLQISGTLEASDDRSDYSGYFRRYWLIFDSVEKLSVNGGGTLNGNGNMWWENSCKRNKKKHCKDAPTAVTFYKCRDLTVEDLTIVNAQQMHVRIQDSVNVNASGLKVIAPESSPNTDGIHVTNSQIVQISSSIIGTGDDCISIVDGTSDLIATDITCGPGHGISIGSLGARGAKEFVTGIKVNGAKLSGTKNGVRIKTWQGGSGMASNIEFRNIEMDNVTNPIIIDQNYCDKKEPCQKQKSAVQIKNVLYQNISGTSASDVAVKFDCSESFPCKEIIMQNIDLQGEEGKYVEASCNNVQLSYLGDVNPSCCS